MSIPEVEHTEILRYEEFLRICKAAVTQGFTCFKVTGGEPLVRKDAIPFMAQLKALPGVKNVTLTTNGYFLAEALPALQEANIDGINISMDTLDPAQFQKITGVDGAGRVFSALKQCIASGIRTKINVVLLEANEGQILSLAALAKEYPVDIRFIELMPIGFGRRFTGLSADEALQHLRGAYPDIAPVQEKRGNGPAAYYKSKELRGRIGIIAANSHKFCKKCNRMRLTSTGLLKPCLCYEDSIALKPLLRSNRSDIDAALAQAFQTAATRKPAGHCFGETDKITEGKTMNQIGG
jgi:cyclic pyranopterin phosphate synthase